MSPQHFTQLQPLSAQVCRLPPAIVVSPLVCPLPFTGVCRLFPLAPLLRSPEKLYPQHFTPPPLVSAQLWAPPAAIAVTPLVRPLAFTGVSRSFPLVPSPSSPSL